MDAHLDAAHRALTDVRPAEALRELLAAWRSCRAEALADVVAALSDRIAAARPRIQGKTQQEALVAWVGVARRDDPSDLGTLLLGLDEAIALGHARLVAPRLDELVKRADDPRLTPAMLGVLAIPGRASAWNKVFLRACRGLAAAGDPRAIRGIEERLAGERDGVPARPSEGVRAFVVERGTKTLAALRERFPGDAPALPSGAAAALAEVLRRIEALPARLPVEEAAVAPVSEGDPEALMAAVLAAPDDDAIRLVLADALQERGDPRGELISLQIARAKGPPDPRALKRERALLNANAKTWLGPLAAVVRGPVFERGFLDACTVEMKTKAAAITEGDHPEWATVRAITFVRTSRITPAMRSLEIARGLDDAGLAGLCRAGHPRVRVLEVLTPGALQSYDSSSAMLRGVPRSPGLKALAATKGLPALRELSLGIGAREYEGRFRDRVASDFDWLWRAPVGPALASLEVPCSPAVAGGWIEVFRERRHLERVVLHHPSITSVLERSPLGVALTISEHLPGYPEGTAPPYVTIHFGELLEALDPGVPLASLELVTTPPLRLAEHDAGRLRRLAQRVKALERVTLLGTSV